MDEHRDGVDAQDPAEVPAAEPVTASGTTVFTSTLHRVRKGMSIELSQTPPREPIIYPARIAITLALAHKLQQAIDEGRLKDRAEVARSLGVSRARITQIMNLLLIRVAEQERILFLEAVDGREPVTERGLRLVLSGPERTLAL